MSRARTMQRLRRGVDGRGGGAGSAKNPGLSWECTAKCLISEASAATRQPVFATGRAVFATRAVSVASASAPSLLLSNSLKKKKKEQGERHGIRPAAVPRVIDDLPRVGAPACFSCHGSAAASTADPWRIAA
ncbi:hypothetical protein [Burkholderia stagnalis]|uniref:hypothetical protein n=1 Tax=Burkholderia stagnalis TaxID=1503054 RepID=UPI000B039FE8|nr:hypothetical protein [Burkholderia stagnalis]